MQNAEYAARIEAVKQRAHGRWTEILGALGLDERLLKRRPMPCPVCKDGVDRFQYTDKYGEGNYHCRKCGPGGGFKLLQACKGLEFHAALCAVEKMLGMLPPARPIPAAAEAAPERMKKLVQRIWNEARAVTLGDEVDRYLRGRGLSLSSYPASLRFHPALGYYQKEGAAKARKVAEYPAMLASVQDAQGAVTLHRTYLSSGRKLDAPDAKKVLSSGFAGGAVRLADATDELAVCEGIETGIAVLLAHGKPVWCALSAGNLEKLWIPDSVRSVCIYSDNDADGDYTGQASAYALARRLRREPAGSGPRTVRVFVPRQAGTDWADVWRQRQEAVLLRAA
ncbi:toprim domain-containing protein [Paracidovorax anthurii]|uniref:Putative DNA primase/helicase n=1 Tax=Paracidovorax anthurii TaxID=78229 RepID=A0A328YW54_9BURK|nr:toprim domain-containing protein [Paracidovorax anthurii]RAR78188.1 putative DNA primase/helicase [Paracidovorax anthurii]